MRRREGHAAVCRHNALPVAQAWLKTGWPLWWFWITPGVAPGPESSIPAPGPEEGLARSGSNHNRAPECIQQGKGPKESLRTKDQGPCTRTNRGTGETRRSVSRAPRRGITGTEAIPRSERNPNTGVPASGFRSEEVFRLPIAPARVPVSLAPKAEVTDAFSVDQHLNPALPRIRIFALLVVNHEDLELPAGA